MKLFYTLLLFIFVGGCTDDLNETQLVTQLMGTSCDYLAEIPSKPYELGFPNYRPNCQATGIFSSWTEDNYRERCIVSGAICMVELGKVSDSTLKALDNFLRVGMNDIDLGESVFPIRGPVAIIYAKLAKTAAIPAIEAAQKRGDTTERSPGGEYGEKHDFKAGTAAPYLKEALNVASPK